MIMGWTDSFSPSIDHKQTRKNQSKLEKIQVPFQSRTLAPNAKLSQLANRHTAKSYSPWVYLHFQRKKRIKTIMDPRVVAVCALTIRDQSGRQENAIIE